MSPLTGGTALDFGHQCDLARARKRPGRLDRVADDLVELRVGELQLQAVRVEARNEEQVADQPLQPLGAAVDDREEPLLLLVELARLAFADHLEEAHHRRQRRPQLVRHRCDEVVLQPVELPLVGDVAQRPEPADEAAAIVEHRRGEALEDAASDAVLELVEGRFVRVGAQALHRPPVGLLVPNTMLDREQAVDDRPVVAHAHLPGEPDERSVRELHVAVGVREQDAVDRRVEHRAQDVRQALQVDVLLCKLLLVLRERRETSR